MQGGQENQFEEFDNSMMEEGIDGGMNIPIYFFFKLGTAELTDQSQLVNLQELANRTSWQSTYRSIKVRESL